MTCDCQGLVHDKTCGQYEPPVLLSLGPAGILDGDWVRCLIVEMIEFPRL